MYHVLRELPVGSFSLRARHYLEALYLRETCTFALPTLCARLPTVPFNNFGNIQNANDGEEFGWSTAAAFSGCLPPSGKY
jgi:hypothetical protein